MTNGNARHNTELLADGTRAKQLSMLSKQGRHALTPPPSSPFPGELSSTSSLALALVWFDGELARRDYAKRTRDNYLISLRRLLHCVGQTRELRSIHPYDVRRFRAWLQDQGLASKTQELTITAVRTFFALLVDTDVLSSNPAEDLLSTK